MVKKSKKISEHKKDKKRKELTKEEIKDLKKNLLAKSDLDIDIEKENKKIKSIKKKEKEKKKEIKEIKKEEKKIKNKIKETKHKVLEEEEEIQPIKIKKIENGGINENINNDVKNTKGNKKSNIINNNSPTLLEIIKTKDNSEEVPLNEDNYGNKYKNNNKKGQKKYSIDNKSEDIISKNQNDDKNEYIKKLKSKIVMVNGKMVMEKPDVGLINKKYNEEHYKNISPIETIFVSNEEKVVNSLSFIDMKPTKKWSEEETNLFYKAIELFGLDFSLFEIVIKQRTREEIKRKYLKEKKDNYEAIEKALNARKNSGKLKQILELYKNEKGQNNLGLFKEESFRSRRNGGFNNEKIDYNKEYKNILNSISQ